MEGINMVSAWVGYVSLIVFVVAYLAIAMEEHLHINKSKPALFAGTFIYILIGIYLYSVTGGHVPEDLHENIVHLIYEIASIFFFLYVAMTYIEALIERNVFDRLKYNLMIKGYDYKKLFWATGFIAFFLSPVADNLTTALILSTVLITLERNNKTFLVAGAINIVVAANAGGAWSPFGDITTLMVWAAGKGEFAEFLFLFPASFVGWYITAFLLSKYVPEGTPGTDGEKPQEIVIKNGGKEIIGLGVLTIVCAVLSHQLFHLPAFWGMMFGLSLLKLYSYFLKKRQNEDIGIFKSISKIENDTLLFFFGLLGAVGGLSFIGYLAVAATVYDSTSHTVVNIAVGLISAVVDNVPVMFAVLKASPEMTQSQWMLVTLTAGVGGSLISFGSAAGVGVMGKLKGVYTFGAHMKYAWTVAVGYVVSIVIWYVQFELLGFHLSH